MEEWLEWQQTNKQLILKHSFRALLRRRPTTIWFGSIVYSLVALLVISILALVAHRDFGTAVPVFGLATLPVSLALITTIQFRGRTPKEPIPSQA
jgi:small-conductance mechanosensitive channel